jgi:hypothetical protein
VPANNASHVPADAAPANVANSFPANRPINVPADVAPANVANSSRASNPQADFGRPNVVKRFPANGAPADAAPIGPGPNPQDPSITPQPNPAADRSAPANDFRGRDRLEQRLADIEQRLTRLEQLLGSAPKNL